jgi:SAM-dependent methyltransferase
MHSCDGFSLYCFLILVGVITHSTSSFDTHPRQAVRWTARSRHVLKVGNSEDDASRLSAKDKKKADKKNSFLSEVQSSLAHQEFISVLLGGPSKKGKTKEALRGCIRQVQGRLVELKGDTLLQLTIKYHGATDVAKNFAITEAAQGLDALFSGSDFCSEWGTLHPLGSPLGIQTGELVTTKSLVSYPSLIKKRNTAHAPPGTISNHDRSKITPLSRQAPFMQALGLVDENGQPKPARSAKVRQCQKFVEVVSQLLDPTEVTKISTTDMGCGRGYLTFSWHHYLTEKYGGTMVIQSKGIDVRPKLVKEMNDIATALNMDGLVFEEGTIEDGLQSVDRNDRALQILIALHACDTATDDAIWYGLSQQADVIVVAPCCHNQIRKQLDTANIDGPLAHVLRHNIYRERMAEMVTDSIRALLLEIANYQTQVFEFIGGEHTSKNVMITAVKRKKERSDKELEDLRLKLNELAILHGVGEQRLAKWMNEDVGSGAKISSKKMPPL